MCSLVRCLATNIVLLNTLEQQLDFAIEVANGECYDKHHKQKKCTEVVVMIFKDRGVW